MRKKNASFFIPFLIFVLFLFLLSSCKKEKEEEVSDGGTIDFGSDEVINIGNYAFFEPFGINQSENMDFMRFDSAEEIFSRLLSGDIDLGYIPSECLEKLSRRESLENAIVPLGPVQKERFFIVARKDSKILFDRNGFSFDDIRKENEKILCFNFSISSYYKAMENIFDLLDFSLSNDQLIPALVSGKYSYAILPIEYAELAVRKSPDLHKAVELDGVSGFVFPEIVLAANGRFYKNHLDLFGTIVK
ncbi:MAG: hypothetical protein IJP61_04155 [Treponema sp.]|nr:hypothetical protein [Treponema sp.]